MVRIYISAIAFFLLSACGPSAEHQAKVKELQSEVERLRAELEDVKFGAQRLLAQAKQDGFVWRVSYPVVPPHVEYSLTPLGDGIGRQVEGLTDWIEINLPKIIKAQQTQA